jgi:branched-chain amino acid aminotransferase
MLNQKIWFNGNFKDFSECNIDLFTHGLHYGTSVFEGARAYNGVVFKMQQHNQRLIDSGKIVDIQVGYSVEELNFATKELLKINNLKNAYIRPIAFKANEMLGLKSLSNSVNVAIMAWPWPSYYGDDKVQKGIRLCDTNWVRPHPKSAATNAKVSGSYYLGAMIQNDAVRRGYEDALMLDWRGYIAECSACNIFFVFENGDKSIELHTAKPDCFLNGITRQTVFEIAEKNNIKVYERFIHSDELSSFKESFVTGTAVEIMPVASIFDKYNYTDFTNSLYIRKQYLDLVNQE